MCHDAQIEREAVAQLNAALEDQEDVETVLAIANQVVIEVLRKIGFWNLAARFEDLDWGNL